MKFAFLRQLPGTLYSAVLMELFERLAYYGMVLVLGIYLMQHLGMRPALFGTLYGIFTAVLYFLPILAGALADRFGYRPALVLAFSVLAAGYSLLGTTRSFPLIVLALGLIAVGGSIVKPTISGTVTRTTEAGSTRPVGFGLYYTMINAGGLVGPVLAAQIRNRAAFRYVFLASAAACALMLLQALLAYREPVPEAERRAGKCLKTVFREMVMVLGNWRFVLLLVLFSGFWGMFNGAMYGFMPTYLETFTGLRDTEAAIARWLPFTRHFGHWLNAEVFISLDALLIVLLQGPVSYLTRRWPTLRAMSLGTFLATVSWLLPMASPLPAVVALGIVVWTLGEVTCSARFFEYCGSVAPRDQVAVYLGYAFLSIFLGNLIAGPWCGFLYQRFVRGPMEAGLGPSPWGFFGGVMLLGGVSTVGLLVYGRFVAHEDLKNSEG
ncbi:MAG: MFS transporter [Acidobacteria bacterium]|nr:MFS transporter [Acidobacteriota bacterium]